MFPRYAKNVQVFIGDFISQHFHLKMAKLCKYVIKLALG